MKKILIFLSISLCCLLTGCLSTTSSYETYVDMTPRMISTNANMKTTEIIEEVRSAVVGIEAKSSYGTSIGSGVAIAEDGYILTNAHVVSGAKSLKVYFADKTFSSAEIMLIKSGLDIAIIKTDINLPYLDTAPLSDVHVGENVIAIGTPISLTFKHTVTKGIVSALGRTLEVQDIGGYTTYMQNLIQHDASINAGNSGGPLINESGKLIGINTLKATDAEGIGFAIPIETANVITSKIQQTGSFEPANLGVFAYDAEIANFHDQTIEKSGVYVEDILQNSSAFKFGLMTGDVIIAVNDKEIKTNLDLQKALFSLNKNDKYNVSVIRNGKIIKINIG